MPVLALVLGLGWATLVHGLPLWHRSPAPTSWRAHVRPLLGGVLLASLVLGAIPTWLGPTAPWRTPIWASLSSLQSAVRGARGQGGGPPRLARCTEALRDDISRGLDPAGKLHGGVFSE